MFGSQKRAEKIYDNAGYSKFTLKAFVEGLLGSWVTVAFGRATLRHPFGLSTVISKCPDK